MRLARAVRSVGLVCTSVIAVAGCGSSTPTSSQVARDLSACVVQSANLGGALAAQTPCGPGEPFADGQEASALCVHGNGDQFQCAVTGGGRFAAAIDGTYAVTDDGHAISYAPAP